ncbi:MAG TPA: polysaccharide biosynthesis/export family protein [Pyrinomonadaceae bacterium]|nr:polysaccharide biosynthesis/export family protein [Pyrinomonadaceae bacterium]
MNTVIRIATLTLGVVLAVCSAASAQPQKESAADKTRQRIAASASQDQTKGQKPAPAAPGERLEPDDNTKTPSDVPAELQANRHEQMSEESAVVPYYNNFFSTYRLGPEDVISVTVFGHDRYSRSGITVPPSGRISLALIPGGVFVVGKTVDEVAEQIKQRYDEYIIDPQVHVTLEKGMSYRYSIIGDVAQPGIRLMSRRMTVTEAIGEAGGVLPTGNKSKVMVLRRQPSGVLAPIEVNVAAIYKGRAPDSTYLVPGDQIFVPGNKMKTFQKIMSLTPILSFARIFTGIPY